MKRKGYYAIICFVSHKNYLLSQICTDYMKRIILIIQGTQRTKVLHYKPKRGNYKNLFISNHTMIQGEAFYLKRGHSIFTVLNILLSIHNKSTSWTKTETKTKTFYHIILFVFKLIAMGYIASTKQQFLPS